MYFPKFLSLFGCVVVFGTILQFYYVVGVGGDSTPSPSSQPGPETSINGTENTNEDNTTATENTTDTIPSISSTATTTIFLAESEQNCSNFSDMQECCNTTHNCTFCDVNGNGTCVNKEECQISNDKC
ncbi:unnamed protein product, partial [Lymnaea stagnalis]